MFIKLGFELEIGCLTLCVFKFRKITLDVNKALLHTYEIVPCDIKGEFREVKRKLFSFEYICIETVYSEQQHTIP